MRWLLLCLLVCSECVGQPVPPVKPVLYVVHSDNCGPCVVFADTWKANPEFRKALLTAFQVRSIDWGLAKDRAAASRLKLDVRRLPSYFVLRDDRQIAAHRGFAVSLHPQAVAAAITDLMCALNVEWPPARPAPVPVPDPKFTPQNTPKNEDSPKVAPTAPEIVAPKPQTPPPAVDAAARDELEKLQTQTLDLQQSQAALRMTIAQLQGDVAGVRGAVTESGHAITNQLRSVAADQAATQSGLGKLVDVVRESVRRANEPVRNQEDNPRLAPTAGTGGTGGAAGWLLKTGLTGAAMYFGLPVAGASVGAAAVGWLLRRRTAGRAARDFRPRDGPPAAAGAASPAAGDNRLPREYDEAVEVLQLAEREGRVPIHEALRGCLAGDEIDKLCEQADPLTKQLGTQLRDRIAQRFNSIAPISQNPKSFDK